MPMRLLIGGHCNGMWFEVPDGQKFFQAPVPKDILAPLRPGQKMPLNERFFVAVYEGMPIHTGDGVQIMIFHPPGWRNSEVFAELLRGYLAGPMEER